MTPPRAVLTGSPTLLHGLIVTGANNWNSGNDSSNIEDYCQIHMDMEVCVIDFYVLIGISPSEWTGIWLGFPAFS